MSQDNITLIKSLYEVFGRGDIPAVLDCFDPTIEWIAADNSPLADRSPYHGVHEVREQVFRRVVADFDVTIEVDELFDAGEKVVMLGFYHGVRKATGKRFRAQAAHIWTIAAGKVAKFQQYTDTYQLAESARML
jgi:ketosteroid isomerase-like protein